ncbi:MAG: hypothetical protein AAF498_11600 [Pseudomonadota bacterium]
MDKPDLRPSDALDFNGESFKIRMDVVEGLAEEGPLIAWPRKDSSKEGMTSEQFLEALESSEEAQLFALNYALDSATDGLNSISQKIEFLMQTMRESD